MIPVTVPSTVTILGQHNDRTWHATLPNGKKVIAFRTLDEATLPLAIGDLAHVELNVGDFSQAHVLLSPSAGQFV